jgi:AraC-like DNA-binding protein
LAGSVGWHSHPAAQWIAAGKGFATLETEEGQWAVFPGRAIIIASDVPHDLRWHGAEEVASVYMEPDAVSFQPKQTCRHMTVSPLLEAAVATLIGENWPYDLAGRAGLLAPVILDEIQRDERPLFGLPTPDSRPLRMLCRQLRENSSDQRDIDAWADAVGVSRRTLTRRFRDETGLSFVEWRQRAKVLHALRRTMDGAPPQLAAKQAGYPSVHAMRAEIRKAVA